MSVIGSPLRSFYMRAVSTGLLVCIICAAILFRPVGLKILALGVGILSFIEWFRVAKQQLQWYEIALVIGLVALSTISFVLSVLLVISLLLSLYVFHHPQGLERFSTLVDISVHAALGMLIARGEILFFQSLSQHTISLFVFVWAVAISVDTLGYLIGNIFQAKPLAWKVSPKKSAIGYLGAIILTFCWASIMNESQLGNLFVFGLIVFSILGDLFFSLAKRMTGIKDYSQILPGHGGVLDRFDSLYGALFFVYLYESFAGFFWFI